LSDKYSAECAAENAKPCATDADLAAKLKFAAFIVESDAGGDTAEADMIESIGRDYKRMCKKSQAFAANHKHKQIAG
jgi:hypothetical protein